MKGESSTANDEKRFALLIDSDNVSFRYLGIIFDEVSNYGTVTYKRIYGDWTNSASAAWKQILLENTILPIQQYSYTTGKNATDSAMIIDAMDILYSGNVDGFCLVSSDSDFTRLAMRLRESGMMVIGMGEKKTPKPFCVACDIFKYLDILTDEEENGASEKDEEASMTAIDTIERAMVSIVRENGDEERGIGIGELGTRLLKRYPDFDVRNYGYTKLSKLVTSFESLTLAREKNSIYVRIKEAKLGLDEIKSAMIGYVENKGDPDVNLGQLNQWLVATFPQFNVKNYGYAAFSKFVNDVAGLVIVSSGKKGCVKNVRLQSSGRQKK